MALTGTDRGTGTHNVGATSFTLNPGSNCTAGALVILCVSADNSSSAGATNDFTTVTDTLGNRWIPRQLPIFDNGAASAGVQGAIFTTDQAAGALQTGTTITVGFGSSPVAKTWTLMEVTAAAGLKAGYMTGGVSAGQSGVTAPTMTTGTITIGDLCVAMFAMESGTTQTCTQDSDTTNGSWSAQQYTEIGTTAAGACVVSQRKVQTTANSTQTYNVTLGLAADTIGAWALIREVSACRALAALGVG